MSQDSKTSEIPNQLFSSLLELSKSAQFLNPNDLPFYHSTVSEFSEKLNSIQSRLVAMINKTLKKAVPIRPPLIQDVQSLKQDYSKMTDTVDHLLEQVDIYLDEASGKLKKSKLILAAEKTIQPSSYTPIPKPQNQFKDEIDNSNSPFVWKIKFKPNAKRPLNYGMECSEEMGEHLESLGSLSTLSKHPYEHEISTLVHPEFMLQISPEILYKEIQKTPLTWVDTLDKLQELQEILESVTEIAIDLEHHSYRSFQGFTCLMQISTRNEDFIIDTLALRDSLYMLNTCFTNPSIVKVFHGADMDIQWLQRDFGLYIVNLFDTFHASHVLELQGHGLAFLLKNYCDVLTNKKYQLADWRMRPIPDDMLHYARSDTHYLLYIYDRMRNDLISKSDPQTLNLLMVVLSRSSETALKVYVKDIYDAENGEGPSGWKNTLRKFNRNVTVEKFAVFRALHAWRDHIARKEDESLHYVMPNYVLFNLVENMPTNSEQVLGCCNPIPRLVRTFAKELADLISHCKLETEQNQKAKERELQILNAAMEAKEREWELKRLNGPVHTRFKDADMEDVQPLAPLQSEPIQGERATNLSVAGLSRQVGRVQLTLSLKKESDLFGNCLSSSHVGSEKTVMIQKKIQESLVHRKEELIEKIHKIQKILQQEQVEQVQESLQTVEKSPEEVPASSPTLKRKSLELETIEILDESVPIVSNVGKKRKKSKKGKKSLAKSASLKSEDLISLDFSASKSSIAKQFERMDQV